MKRRKVIYKEPEIASLLTKVADKKNRPEQIAALQELASMVALSFNLKAGFMSKREAEALEVVPSTMIQEGVMSGDIYSSIFETNMIGWDESPSYPMDFVQPGTEGEFTAYTMGNTGRIPTRVVEGDEVTVNTYDIANAIDWSLKYARAGRVDVFSRAVQVLQAGFVKKLNDDAWHTLLAAALDRGLTVYDSTATAGTFSKKLLSLMKVAFMRNGGGNSASGNKFNLTDLFISPEAMEDIRSFSSTDLSDINRADVEIDPNGTVKRIYDINLHVLTELGENQEYQNYYTNVLSGTMPGSKLEIVVGLDLTKPQTFVMPVRGNGVEIYADESQIRSRVVGLWGEISTSFAVLDNRCVMLGAV